jgi:predicted permease
MFQDLTIAVRTLLKRPAYALPVTLTLALGIGATTLMFSLFDASLLRPLPFADSHRLAFLTGVAGPQRSPRGGSFPEVADWRGMNTTFDDVSLYDETSLNLRIGTEAIRVETEMVNAGFFALLGVQAAKGRTFLPEEDAVPDRNPVALISHALWMTRFGGDPGVLARQIHLNDRAFSIVGVMPEGFSGLSFDTDLWVPSMMVSLTSAPSVVENRGTRWLGAIGRLKTGVILPRAQDDLTRVAKILEDRHPESNRQRSVDVTDLREALLGDTGDLVVALFGAVLLFLLVACANVASIQIARATSRRRELAVRVALGARPFHVIRQLLTESLVLSATSGILGVMTAAWALTAVLSVLPAGALPRYVNPDIDIRALAFAIMLSLLAGALIAVLPAIAAMRRDLSGAIKEGARSAGPGLGSIRRPSPQQILVTAEVALAVTLLTAAGLMVRSLDRQMNVRTGFDPAGVTVARITLPAARYAPPQRAFFVRELTDELRKIPGVASAAVATSLPFTGNASAGTLVPDGDRDPNASRRYFRNSVTPDLFSTLQIPVLRGRAFTEQDVAGAPLVAMISESGARQLWKDDDAVGRRIRLGDADGPAVEIVGVIADARFRDLTTDLSAPRVEPDLYFPYGQRSDRDIEVAVRTDGAVVSLASLQQAVTAVDSALPLYAVQRLEEALRQQTATQRFGSSLLTLFSAGALLLAGIGLYGLITYVVGLSRREIAIRLALGASSRRVVALIATNGMTLVCGGILLGAVGAILAGRALEAQLFQTSSIELPTLAAVSLLTLAVAFGAIVIPTRRAAGVDPQAALRGD